MTRDSHDTYAARPMTGPALTSESPAKHSHAGGARQRGHARGPRLIGLQGCALWVLLASLLGSGCDIDLDPDTLVREIRVLGVRFGDAAPASESDVIARVTLGAGGQPDVTFSRPEMRIQALAAAPTGLGRRVATPRPLLYDWFVCTGPLSLFSPGVLDPQCRKLGPKDPPARKNTALRPLLPVPSTSSAIALDAATLKSILSVFLQALLSPSAGGGSGGGMITLPERPVVLLLPIVVEVSAQGGDANNPLDREVAFSFLRVIVTLPGMDVPPANRNPSLAGQGGFFVGTAEGEMAPRSPLAPCPFENLSGEAEAGQPACSRFAATRTAPVFVQARSDVGSTETYVPLDDSGRGPQTESMRYSWFATDGTFSDERTGDKSPETRWENGDRRPAPPEVRVVDIWVVVQDGRGGADFARAQLSLM